MEEDPMEILQSVYTCIEQTVKNLQQMKIPISSIKGKNALIVIVIVVVFN